MNGIKFLLGIVFITLGLFFMADKGIETVALGVHVIHKGYLIIGGILATGGVLVAMHYGYRAIR